MKDRQFALLVDDHIGGDEHLASNSEESPITNAFGQIGS
jgi:hypothetical protein